MLAAATPAEQLRQAEQARLLHLAQGEAAARALSAARAQGEHLAAERVQTADRLRGAETAVLDASRALALAEQRRAIAEASLAERQAELSRLLPLMLRLARAPAETVLAVPLPPDQALAGLLVTRGLATQIERDARALRAQQALALRTGAEVAARAETLRRQRQQQQALAGELDRQIAATAVAMDAAEQQAAQAEQAAAAEAARAGTLRQVIASMEAARLRAQAQAAREEADARRRRLLPQAQAAHARGLALARPAAGGALRLLPPAAGEPTTRFGAPAEDGPATGLTLATLPSAVVVSPCQGRVAFAAPFRSYGRLIIVECGASLDIVLAGLDRLDVAVGRGVRQGEPLGRMGARTPSLYMELRRDGQAQDPAPFLSTHG